MREADNPDGGARSRPSLRELEVLHAVIATRKTTAAAHRLGISQPAVSRAIGALEARVGRQLFLRDGGRLVPTADAFALDREASPIFAAMERLDGWPTAQRAGSLLRVVAPPTFAQNFLPDLVARFLAAEPDLRMQMEIGRSGDVISAVAEGAADIGFVNSPTNHAGIAVEVLRRSRAHCVMWPDHALAGRPLVGPADLVEAPLVALTRRFASRAVLDRAFDDAGVAPRIVLEGTTSAFVVDMVRRRVGVTIINPFPLTLIEDPGLVFVPFDAPIEFETSVLLPAAGATLPAARRFADFVRAEQPTDAYTTTLR